MSFLSEDDKLFVRLAAAAATRHGRSLTRPLYRHCSLRRSNTSAHNAAARLSQAFVSFLAALGVCTVVVDLCIIAGSSTG